MNNTLKSELIKELKKIKNLYEISINETDIDIRTKDRIGRVSIRYDLLNRIKDSSTGNLMIITNTSTTTCIFIDRETSNIHVVI